MTHAQLVYLLDARRAVGVMAAARALGLLERLARGPLAAEDLTDCPEERRRIGNLLVALAALGLAEREGRTFRPALSADTYGVFTLTPTTPDSTRPAQHDVSDPEAAARLYRRGAPFLSQLMGPPAEAMAARLSLGPGPLLDLGAGGCPWSRALHARHPELAITAVDLPPVVEACRSLLPAATWVGADVIRDPLPEGPFDTVLLGNFCHLFDEDTCAALLRKAAARLAPGGQVVILDALADDLDDPRVALYAVDLATRAPQGGVYPLAQFSTWLEGAGCDSVRAERLGAGLGMRLVTARRQAA